jgi:hypothetical protein
MKCLHLNIYFKLPDDFNGDLNNAIEELLEYRKKPKPKSEFIGDRSLTNYENWWKMINETESKLFGEFSVSELDESGNWTYIDEKSYDIDEILDKIKNSGIESLDRDELDFLIRSSKDGN